MLYKSENKNDYLRDFPVTDLGLNIGPILNLENVKEKLPKMKNNNTNFFKL